MRTTKQQERPEQDTRGRILDAAALEFARRGFAGASTRSIVAAANANIGLISYYFGSKEGLFEQVVVRGARTLTDHINQSFGQNLPRADRLIGFLQETVRLTVPNHIHFLVIVARESFGTEPGPLSGMIAGHLAPHREILAEILDEGAKAGTLLPTDPEAFYVMFMGALAALSGWPSLRPAHSETAVTHMIELLVRGILRDPTGSATWSTDSAPEAPGAPIQAHPQAPNFKPSDSFDIGTVD